MTRNRYRIVSKNYGRYIYDSINSKMMNVEQALTEILNKLNRLENK